MTPPPPPGSDEWRLGDASSGPSLQSVSSKKEISTADGELLMAKVGIESTVAGP